jgi:hypothetical protein
MQNAQWGALRGENMKPRTLNPSPISMKQIVQGDGWKTWKDT